MLNKKPSNRRELNKNEKVKVGSLQFKTSIKINRLKLVKVILGEETETIH
jgi:hypothetical protein